MAQPLTFSIGVSTYNRNDDLARCLQSLTLQSFKDFEVIIVNGGEVEGVMGVVAKFPGLRINVVTQERKGIVEARNLAWRHSSADVVCLIDDDLEVEPQWLEEVRASFTRDERIGGVSGPTIIPEERLRNRDLALFLEGFRRPKNIFMRIGAALYLSIILEHRIKEVGRILKSGAFTPGSNYPSSRNIESEVEVDYLEACHMCFRRKLLSELGGFDYAYTGTGEWNEPDFSFRVRAAGYRLVFNPKAVTYHLISQAGVFKARTNSEERSRNFILFYRRWVRADSAEKFLRFGANLVFINLYWCYKFLQSGNPDWLRGIAGTVGGLLEKNVCVS